MLSHRLGFTLIEMLVVIAIMAVVAGLTVGLARHATTHKKIVRVEAELQKWVTMIENYQHKLGTYPPCNTNDAAASPLVYELAGSKFDGTTYTLLTTQEQLPQKSVATAFNISGFVNSALVAGGEPGDVTSFGRTIGPGDVTTMAVNGITVTLPKVPVEGVNGNLNNTWHYMSTPSPAYPNLHNPNSYDLWAEIVTGGETNLIGNWKR